MKLLKFVITFIKENSDKPEKVPILGIFFFKDHFNVNGRVKNKVGRETGTTHIFHLRLNAFHILKKVDRMHTA